ncbi:hypothetical protein EDB85DRAFT_553021 [Lactarius pseudohatsudake]|nr:hypothetical protein EDB85DRAFT_553021 [Lactarius pseudohatsudake]
MTGQSRRRRPLTATTREYDNDHADEATSSTPSTSDHNDHGGQATTTRQLRRRRGLPVVIPGFTSPSLLFGLGIQVYAAASETLSFCSYIHYVFYRFVYWPKHRALTVQHSHMTTRRRRLCRRGCVQVDP